MRIILASGSPRRKELLSLVTPKFDVIISDVDEKLETALTVEEQAVNLAYKKAKDIYNKTEGDRIIIGSDTIVVKNEKIYGKPKNKQDAKEMIKKLLEGDKTHEIITGLSVLIQVGEEYTEHKIYDKVKVFFNDISNKEINKWLETGKAMDKAGAYAIQEEFSVFVEKIEGNYMTAVGLPINKLYNIIKKYL